ncbi:hypothetical protein [Lentilactobacillus buchneri]|uniref:Uncharacterized protein n=1 Tax=Lentilactobacillus buchneri subsp. silagei CD034 TaxID=1071400 RepID=J9W4T9_LENBU|nr:MULTISPECIES: hypothetical protein [Lentilactobacillus]MCC6102041.1 hypothetical protein [Lactobacillus sp.]AFS01349.1 hypothetical protein LBUCD034_2382 [Lentilactobacillus buchneri subsp. silagei CD034]MCT2901076.1 hypothetical protein [Lentilactobacillus buchneri]MCT3542690.1 hypothetical protein [Lentilactobacillus buchneri]MCT3545831.1 hypothetical protein [Lentilactobacillus buchneri]
MKVIRIAGSLLIVNLTFGFFNELIGFHGIADVPYEFNSIQFAISILLLVCVLGEFTAVLDRNLLSHMTSIISRYHSRRKISWGITNNVFVFVIIQSVTQMVANYMFGGVPIVWSISVLVITFLGWATLLITFLMIVLRYTVAVAYLNTLVIYSGCLFIGHAMFQLKGLREVTGIFAPQFINYSRVILSNNKVVLVAGVIVLSWLVLQFKYLIKNYDFLKG